MWCSERVERRRRVVRCGVERESREIESGRDMEKGLVVRKEENKLEERERDCELYLPHVQSFSFPHDDIIEMLQWLIPPLQ